MTSQEIGARIRAARIEKGYTQKAFAEAIGVTGGSSDAFVRMVESGRRFPPYDRLRTIALVLGLSLYDLVP